MGHLQAQAYWRFLVGPGFCAGFFCVCGANLAHAVEGAEVVGLKLGAFAKLMA